MQRELLTSFMMKAPYQPATNYWRSIEIGQVIQYGLPEGRGLDLGCGDGHLMSIILEHLGPRNLAGVDIDPEETALAKQRNIYQEVVTSPGHSLPFENGHFDFVFSNSVLEHIPNIDEVLAEVARVLKPSGRFIFTVPSADFHNCLKGPRNPKNRELYLQEIDARCYHLRYWSAEKWSHELDNAGLRQTHSHQFLTAAQVRRWESIARNTSGLLYTLSGKRKQPIDIQRKMGIRRIHSSLPRPIALLSSFVLDWNSPADAGAINGCLLIEARNLS